MADLRITLDNQHGWLIQGFRAPWRPEYALNATVDLVAGRPALTSIRIINLTDRQAVPMTQKLLACIPGERVARALGAMMPGGAFGRGSGTEAVGVLQNLADGQREAGGAMTQPRVPMRPDRRQRGVTQDDIDDFYGTLGNLVDDLQARGVPNIREALAQAYGSAEGNGLPMAKKLLRELAEWRRNRARRPETNATQTKES
ncbi:hypothetical protein [Microbacterium karelineae]|uniref:hypothetical protein n=1 Tax=Microbacterium karelineae TaxID=2654283 RepID=UPI0018D3C2D0|nr:hypothetical protein [Microbacterium karelineae]